MPGYLCVHQVPPKVSCISRMTKLVPGILFRRCQALPMPEMPAPTISTSKCSVACDADAYVLRAASTFICHFPGEFTEMTSTVRIGQAHVRAGLQIKQRLNLERKTPLSRGLQNPFAIER